MKFKRLDPNSGLRILLTVFFALFFLTPSIAAQPTWGITNQGNLQDYPTAAVASSYSCTVAWYVDNPTEADLTAAITLRDLTRGIVLDSRQYLIQRGSQRVENLTTFTLVVPGPMPEWQLEVDIAVLPVGGITMTLTGPSCPVGLSPYCYTWTVDSTAVPEFPQMATMALLISSISAVLVAVSRGTRRNRASAGRFPRPTASQVWHLAFEP